jgi:hypothetical protein
MNATTTALAAALACVFAHPIAAQQPNSEIFDGRSLAGWTNLNGRAVTKGWEVVDGMIHLNIKGGRAGNIVTGREYRNFELRFEWKIAPGGNSGIKYRVRDFDGKVLGCEYQIIDDNGYRYRLPPRGLTGSLYDLYEPTSDAIVRPPGQFNSGRIVVRGNHIEHWLNGRLIVAATVGSDQWRQRIAESKFADVPGFGQNRAGKIMLTDHNSEVWYRNMQLTELSEPVACVRTTTCNNTRRRILSRLFCRRQR